jgi:hypothetical protein
MEFQVNVAELSFGARQQDATPGLFQLKGIIRRFSVNLKGRPARFLHDDILSYVMIQLII